MDQKEILSRLSAINDHYHEVGKQIVDPDIIADMKRYIKLSKEYKELEPISEAYEKYSFSLKTSRMVSK